LEELNYTAAN